MVSLNICQLNWPDYYKLDLYQRMSDNDVGSYKNSQRESPEEIQTYGGRTPLAF